MAPHTTYEFGGFRFEPIDLRLVDGERVIPLTAKAADTLLLLLQQPDVAVTKDALIAALWPGVFVDENNLTQQISALRKALSRNGQAGFIETVPRRGYRFVGPVRAIEGSNGGGAAGTNGKLIDSNAGSTVPIAGVETTPVELGTRSRRYVRWAVAAVALLLLAAGAGVWWQSRRDVRESERALARGTERLRVGDARAAVTELQKAIRLDPANARAHATLAHALNSVSFHDALPRPPGRSPSVDAAERAVALDPGCGSCQGTLGFFLFYHDWQWARAESHLREAIRLEPDRESIRPPFALLLTATGRAAQGLEQIDFALSKRPYEIGWHQMRASILYSLRRYPDAIAAADQALAIDDTVRQGWEWRSKALFQLDRGEEAISALAHGAFAGHASVLEQAVRDGGAAQGLRALLEITGNWKDRSGQSWRRGPWRALLHDTEGALDELERAHALRNVNLMYLNVDPVYDGLRAHPRFQTILAAMGLQPALEEFAAR